MEAWIAEHDRAVPIHLLEKIDQKKRTLLKEQYALTQMAELAVRLSEETKTPYVLMSLRKSLKFTQQS